MLSVCFWIKLVIVLVLETLYNYRKIIVSIYRLRSVDIVRKKVMDYLEQHKDELFELLSELLKIDTQNFSSYGNEEAGQMFFNEYCHRYGFETEFYYPDSVAGLTEHEGYLKGRGTDKRPNVTAVLRGNGGQKITIAAHMDTVPIGDEMQWSVPPLSGVIKDNRIFGRGSSDDKFGIAAGIFALRAIKECGISLKDDVYVTSYADEEYGGGNGALATCLKYPSDIYINLDGGGMQVLPYGIGGLCASASLHKEETVSSCHEVFDGLKLIVDEFQRFGEKRFEELQKNPIYAKTQIEKDAYRLQSVSCGNDGLDLNIARISFTFYTLLSQQCIETELAEVCETLRTKLQEMGLVFDGVKNISRFFPPVYPSSVPSEAIIFKNILEETYGKPIELAGGCLSDLSVIAHYGGGTAFNTGLYKGFNEYGGPHQIDEYVDCDEFLAITKALAVYLVEKSGSM